VAKRSLPKRTKSKPPRSQGKSRGAATDDRASDLRIIGGKFRGSKLRYHGLVGTRPMKHRVREAIFNLAGPSIRDTHAIDLFAGTGAIGLEAISRGSTSATFIERHVPTARVISENIAALDLADCTEVVTANAFIWARRDVELPTNRWAVFISPPYDFYVDRCQEMLDCIERFVTQAPAESIVLVEADERFDFGLLAEAERWDVRTYSPAVVGILRTRA
jgi:16S rRNA (guanine966-N2)-methyltransferase